MTRVIPPIAGTPFLALLLTAATAFAATPPGATISPASPATSWSGAAFTASNPIGCGALDAACDQFALTIVPPPQDFVVKVRIEPTRMGDDLDLSVRDASGNTITTSGTPGGVEEVVLTRPAAGTYTIVVQPFLVVPGGSYAGSAAIGSPGHDESSNSYYGPLITSTSGVPSSTPAPSSGPFQVSFNYVGRQAAEPTVGVNRNNIAFFAASTFDFPSSGAPARLARTLVMRSTDKGSTWQAVSPPLTSNLPASEEQPTFPPTSLDPYVYVDVVGASPASTAGRVFSIDLDAACGANAIFSDDEGASWTRVPLFACNEPANDHQTVVTAPPPAGVFTAGYPSLLYFCYNQVADATCSRSNNGGLTFTPTAPAFTGADPGGSGSLCGSLTGHLAADSQGRIFLPKGHCGLPWVAVSSDAGNSWTRVNITNLTKMDDHEVTLAVDTADNVYAVWQDGTFRLPYLSISRDHGMSWSTPRMIAPPGVHEVNFPTIAAGDPGRIAVLFPGTESESFTDPGRPWNLYVAISINALDFDPVFTSAVANPRNDPVHRGECGPGRCDAADGGSMFDFLSIVVSPADGALWGTGSDTCTGDCVTNPGARQLRPGEGVAIREVKGPPLYARR
ncbi:MAG TPA: hypothetical protein VGK89_13705 [Candidatus Eisenbacteria bacterium]|jgi:hypothetical protein